MNVKYVLSYTIMDETHNFVYTGPVERVKDFCRVNLLKIVGVEYNKVLESLIRDGGCYYQECLFELKLIS